MKYQCKRCGAVILSRLEGKKPIQCARCKSLYWDKDKVRKIKEVKTNG